MNRHKRRHCQNAEQVEMSDVTERHEMLLPICSRPQTSLQRVMAWTTFELFNIR